MKIKFSGIAIVDARGKVGGSVISKSRSGAYVRNKVTPVNRRTAFQSSVRAVLAFFASGFRALTAIQIKAWNEAANSGFTTTNIFGDTIKKSGLQLYVALNQVLDIIGGTALTTPPTAGSVLGAVELSPSSDVSSTNMFANGTGIDSTTVVPTGMSWIISATPPVSRGVSFVKSQFRVLTVLAAAADSSTTNLWTLYSARFGTPVAGQKIFIQIQGANFTTGQAAPPVNNSLVVTA